MQPIAVGMTVRSLDDRTVGEVTSINPCCVSFGLKETDRTTSVTWAGLYDSQDRVVSLIYVAGEAHRYVCGAHPTAVRPGIVRVATGWAASAGPRSMRPPGARPAIGHNAEHWRLAAHRRPVVAGR